LNSLPYAYSYYLDAICEDWSILLFEDYSAVMPLPLRKKYGIEYVYPPFFIQQLGVFSNSKITQDLVEQFITSIPKEFKFIETNLNYSNLVNAALKKTNLILELTATYESIILGYSKTLKRNLKAIEPSSFEFSESNDTKAFQSFFKKHTLSKTEVIKNSDIGRLEQLINVLMEKKMAKIFVVKKGQKWLSATLFLITEKRIINLFVANSDEAKETNSSAFLLDRIIFLNQHKQVILDFEGSSIVGVARFYKSFGAIEQNYFQYKENRLPSILKWFKN